MAVKILIPTPLRPFAENQNSVEVDAARGHLQAEAPVLELAVDLVRAREARLQRPLDAQLLLGIESRARRWLSGHKSLSSLRTFTISRD